MVLTFCDRTFRNVDVQKKTVAEQKETDEKTLKN
jgi:hypothetical protein